MEHKSFKASVSTAKEAKGELTALVSVFNIVDRANERVMPGAFTKSIARRLPKGVVAHDWQRPFAKTLEARETAEGLVIRAQINTETTEGKEALSNIRFFGSEQEFSIGYQVIRDSIDAKGVRNLEELDLYEFSPVLVGMNSETELISLKTANPEVTEAMSATETKAEDQVVNRPMFDGSPGRDSMRRSTWRGDEEKKSLGQLIVEHDGYKDYAASHSSGSVSKLGTLDVGLKTLLSTSAGWAPQAVRTNVVIPYATQPPRLTDLIPVYPTDQSAFKYMEETTFTNTAAEVAEGGTKPEATLVYTERTSTVRKIAVTLPVTDEQLEDVVGMPEWLNQRLSFMVRQRLDSQIINGDGVSPNLLGILASGIQTQAKGADPTPDAIYKAMTKVMSIGFAEPNAVVLHPNDWQEIRLLRTTDGIYIWGSPADAGPGRIWGLPVITTTSCPEGTGIVGDFSNFTEIRERKGLTVDVGYTGTQFVENKQTVRAELRVAFTVTRPYAMCSITGI